MLRRRELATGVVRATVVCGCNNPGSRHPGLSAIVFPSGKTEATHTDQAHLRDAANGLLEQLGVRNSRRSGRPPKPLADDGSSSVAVSRTPKKRTVSAEAREDQRGAEGAMGEAA